MTDFDVERVVVHEMEQLEQEVRDCRDKAEQYDLYERLVDVQRLHIGHLRERIDVLEAIVNDVACSG